MTYLRVDIGQVQQLKSVLVKTKGYFDPYIVNAFQHNIGEGWNGDFNHDDYYCYFPDTGYGEWGAITSKVKVSQQMYEYIKAIQPFDSDLYQNAGIDQKMNWLCGDYSNEKPARPMWKEKNGTIWFGAMHFGNDQVRIFPEVKEIKTFMPNESMPKEKREFVKVDPFNVSMIAPLGEFVEYTFVNSYGTSIRTRIRSEVIPLIAKGYVQLGSEPQKNGRISWTNKGVKTMPVMSMAGAIPKGEFWFWKGFIA